MANVSSIKEPRVWRVSSFGKAWIFYNEADYRRKVSALEEAGDSYEIYSPGRR